jgi:sugar/nucleoside kinase (ribokinase family)
VFADANIDSIKSNGVDTSLIQKSSTSSTGVGVIHVSADGENCIVVTLGANLELGANRANEIETSIANARLVSIIEISKTLRKYSSLVMVQSEIDQSGNLEVCVEYTGVSRKSQP